MRLPPLALAKPDEVHRKRVEQFIRKMDPGEGRQLIERTPPPDFTRERPEAFLLPRAQNLQALHDLIARRLEKIGPLRLRPFQHVGGERPVIRPLLHDGKVRRPPDPLPHLAKLEPEQLPEDGPHADIGKIIPMAPDRRAARPVIPMPGMVERQLHEIAKSHHPPLGEERLDGIRRGHERGDQGSSPVQAQLPAEGEGTQNSFEAGGSGGTYPGFP